MSERLLTLEKHEVNPETQTCSVRELFRGLPANQKSLQLLELYFPQISTDRQSVIDHYLDVYNLRRKMGYSDPPTIDLNLAIAILDDKLFGEIQKEVLARGEILKTARHEMGHLIVAEALGFSVQMVTVEPGAGYLGLTISTPTQDFAPKELLLRRAAISFGGALAANMMKDPALGAGSDMAYAEILAKIAVAHGLYASEAAFLSDANNMARSALVNYGLDNIENQAKYLAEVGTKAG